MMNGINSKKDECKKTKDKASLDLVNERMDLLDTINELVDLAVERKFHSVCSSLNIPLNKDKDATSSDERPK